MAFPKNVVCHFQLNEALGGCIMDLLVGFFVGVLVTLLVSYFKVIIENESS